MAPELHMQGTPIMASLLFVPWNAKHSSLLGAYMECKTFLAADKSFNRFTSKPCGASVYEEV